LFGERAQIAGAKGKVDDGHLKGSPEAAETNASEAKCKMTGAPPSFRGAQRTRNLEIPGLVLAHHPGMTLSQNGLMEKYRSHKSVKRPFSQIRNSAQFSDVRSRSLPLRTAMPMPSPK